MDPNDPDKRHPEERVVFFDILLQWINPLIKLANKRTLKSSDVWDCPEHETVEVQAEKFWAAWYDECDVATQENRQASLLKALFKAFGTRFTMAGLYQFAFFLLQFAQPFLVGALVGYVRTGEGGLGRGIGLAIGFAAISSVSSIFLSRTFDSLRRLGVAIRSGVMMAVYEQALKLTTASRLQNTVGQTTNLMAIDAEKLNLAVQFIHFLWHGPLVLLVVMIILISEIGYQAALAGMAFIIVLIPLQNRIARAIGIIRREMVKHTDERVKLVNELLQAIRVIKLYAWEEAIEQRVNTVRQQETTWLHTYLNRSGQLRETLFSAQPVAAVIMFSTACYGANRPLSVEQVFRMLAFLNITRFPLNLLAQAMKAVNDGSVSIIRLQNFFLLPSLETARRESAGGVKRDKEEDGQNEQHVCISLSDATYSWEDSRPLPSSGRKETKQLDVGKGDGDLTDSVTSFCLRNVSFTTLKSNELIAVIGLVGSGKSSFMSCLLGEMHRLHGRCSVEGQVAYCAQTPWIQNMTLKQNILFEHSLLTNNLSSEQLHGYHVSVEAAALKSDIAILASGDETEIGEKGINLSGGQKARVSLARAFYSRYRSQIYLLDDPFSAVDGNTGNHIFQQGVVKLLHDKLRVVCLNSHMHLLKFFDRICVIEEGKMVCVGSFDDLFTKHAELMSKITGLTYSSPSEVLQVDLPFTNNPDIETDQIEVVEEGKQSEVSGDCPPPVYLSPNQINYSINITATASKAIISDQAGSTLTKPTEEPKGNGTQLIKQEKMDTGISLLKCYVQYFSASLISTSHLYSNNAYAQSNQQGSLYTMQIYMRGAVLMVLMVILFTITQILRVAVDYYIAVLALNWDDGDKHKFEIFYYGSFGCFVFSLLLRSVYLNFFAVQSSRVLHSYMLRNILTASIPTFFDTTTIGSILNRFAKDMETLDVSIPEFLLQLLINWWQVFSIYALCIWASYYFAILLIPLGFAFWRVFTYFANVSRDLKKLEAISRSPIYSSLSETLVGLETIRAYKDSPRFLSGHLRRMNANQKCLYHLWIAMSWMTVRLELSTSLVFLAISLLCVFLRRAVSPVALGIALSFGLQLTALFQRCVQLIIEMNTYMTSTERIIEFVTTTPAEKNTLLSPSYHKQSKPETSLVSTRSDGRHKDLLWKPESGDIVFDNIWMQYRNNPAVLQGVSIHIPPGQRIGICGRTGSGKSSLMVALFRVVELSEGHIYIDGRDITSIPLTQLRASIAIIPQDPVLFTGSIRFQLDPFHMHSDEEIWHSLEQVQLAQMIRQLPRQLEEEVKENGENLSQGQRQLLCIARALLRRAKILVVDEGTSAVDPHTDELIQQVLRQEAEQRGTTVLAIAHRLQTIADFDRILVLGSGEVLEYDVPRLLLQNPRSVFATMLRQAEH
ncbi:ATP-binding cassette domain-containing protein [archaeon]|nr:MAG: ATP-binding cassette domain-containing protein [archaeon]